MSVEVEYHVILETTGERPVRAEDAMPLRETRGLFPRRSYLTEVGESAAGWTDRHYKALLTAEQLEAVLDEGGFLYDGEGGGILNVRGRDAGLWPCWNFRADDYSRLFVGPRPANWRRGKAIPEEVWQEVGRDLLARFAEHIDEASS